MRWKVGQAGSAVLPARQTAVRDAVGLGGTGDPPVLGGNLPPSRTHDGRSPFSARVVRAAVGREGLRSASRPGSQRVARATIHADFRDAGALHPLRPGTGRGPCGCGTAALGESVICARLSGRKGCGPRAVPGSQRVARATIHADFRDAGALPPAATGDRSRSVRLRHRCVG